MALSAGAVRVDFIADGSGFYRVSGDVLNRTQRLRLGMVRAARAIRRHWKGVAISIAGTGVAITAGVKRMAEYSSSLVEAARASGVAVKELENLRAVLRGDGLEATAADTAFIALNNRLGKAKQGYGEAIRSFEKYGITVTKLNGEFKSTSELMRDVTQVIRGLDDQAVAATIGFDLFGDQGRRIASILRGIEGDFDVAAAAAGRFNTLTDEQHEQNKELNQSLDDFKQSLIDFAFRVLAEASPELRDMIDDWTEWLQKMKDSPETIKRAGDALVEFIDKVGSAWAKGRNIFQQISDVRKGIKEEIEDALDVVRDKTPPVMLDYIFRLGGIRDHDELLAIVKASDNPAGSADFLVKFYRGHVESYQKEYEKMRDDHTKKYMENPDFFVPFDQTPQARDALFIVEWSKKLLNDAIRTRREAYRELRKVELDHVRKRLDIAKENEEATRKMIFPPMHDIEASSKMAHMGMDQWWLSRDDGSSAIAKEYVKMQSYKKELDKHLQLQRQIMRAWDQISMLGLYYRQTPNVGLGAMESQGSAGMWPNIASAYPQMPSQIGGGQIDYQARWQDFRGSDPQMAFGESQRSKMMKEYFANLKVIGTYEQRLAVVRGQQLEDNAAMYQERAEMVKDYHENLNAIGSYESRLAVARGQQLEDDAEKYREIAELKDAYYTTLRENGTYEQRMAVIRGQMLSDEADELQRVADLTKLWNDRLVAANSSFETRMAGGMAMWSSGNSFDSITGTMTKMADELDRSKSKTNELRDAFMNMGNSIVDNFDNMSDALRNFARELVKIGIQRHLLNPAANFLFGPADGGDGGVLGSLFGSAFPAGADGGMFGKGMTLVGERGPELIDFSSPGRVYTNEQLSKAISGAGKGVNITYNINSTDGPGVRAALAEATPGIVRMAESSVADRASRPGPYRQQVRGTF